MQSDFPFVKIDKAMEPIIGIPDEGTHIYRKDGSQEESSAWFDLLTEIIGPSVSPGGVGMYCPVSRAAVYNRVKQGQLSMFLFHVTHRKTTLFGTTKTLRSSPFAYIPVSEARAWRKELEERATSQGRVTQDELEGARPDWHGNFMEWRNERERFTAWDELKQEGIGLTDLFKGLNLARIERANATAHEKLKKQRKK